MNSRTLLACLLAAVITAACDDTFTPITPTDLNFSIFGYLDASADTQWVRVMPLRSTTLTEPGPLGALVTLENLGTGQVIEMRDSVFRFTGNPDVGSDGVFLHNYWTTERIEPGATYRFSAKRGAEKAAEAVVAIPGDYGVEVWLTQDRNGTDLVHLTGLRYVAFVEILTHFHDECGPGDQRTSFETDPSDSDVQSIPVHRRFIAREGCGAVDIEQGKLRIVGSGAEWPSGRGYSPGRLDVPLIQSNVSNSVGFLGGVLTRLVPYENCQLVGGNPSDYCQLRYDETVASVRGTVTDVLCTGAEVAGATVALRELDPVPPAKPRLRFMDTNRLGKFEIGALEPGRYALGVSRFIRSDPLDQYEEHADTLEFAPGEHRTYDVALRRFICPPQ